MSFVTDAELQAKVKLIAEQLNFELTSEQLEIISARNADAYAEILFKLSNQGYNKTQIDQWQAGARYQSDIGTYLSLLDFLGASVNVDDTMLEKYNVSAMLDVEDIVLLDENGEIITPEGPKGDALGIAISEVF